MSYRCSFSLVVLFFFLMIRRPPRSTQSRSSAASDVYKRQTYENGDETINMMNISGGNLNFLGFVGDPIGTGTNLSLIHISEPTRPY